MDLLDESVQTIKGIGPKKAKLLSRLGIYTLKDALYFFPRDYEKHGGVINIASIQKNQKVSLCVKFCGKPQVTRKRKNLSILKWRAKDNTGSVVCVWFNQPYRANQYKEDVAYYVYGKAVFSYGQIQIQNPQIEEYRPEVHDEGRLDPIYSLVEGLTQKDLRDLVKQTLKKVEGSIKDDLPKIIRHKFTLSEKGYALNNIHFPIDEKALEWSRRRLVFEELFYMQMALYAIRENFGAKKEGLIFEWDSKKLEKFIKNLAFSLTGAQKRVVKEILEDFKKGIPMNRLVYGDVGSGKTIVAAIALYVAFLAGYQGVMMAPTEILARQHYKTLKDLLEGLGIDICLLIGGMRNKEKEQVKNRIYRGEADIIIATHAVLQEDVEFSKLGLVITDEQHRFGVRQRAAIMQKGKINPHMLVMSATPIPRTLALIFYGDLDISLIDQLPPGRKPVKTYHVPSSMRQRVYAFIRKQAKLGYQTYLVCPLIEESDKIPIQSAVELYDSLKEGPLSDLRLGLIHGRMSGNEKDEVMIKFQNGEIDVLVSTTVIEVGVNVANANLMVIENAERFGLAQLHQLRGRVGRSDSQAYCILIADTKNSIARERMNIMVKTNNGFEIAQKDLELRGPGDFLGVRQHGLPEFKIANLIRDMDILKEVQIAAQCIMGLDDSSKKQKILDKAYEKVFKKIDEIVFN
mgnify:FL=1